MKIRILSILVLMFFVVCPQAFSEQITNEANPGTVLAAEGGALSFNFSPSVSGMYVTETAGGNEQWFALSTYHPGGQSFYASTSDSSSIYKQSRETNENFDAVTIPDSPVANVITPADPTADPPVAEVLGTADQYFLNNGWTK